MFNTGNLDARGMPDGFADASSIFPCVAMEFFESSSGNPSFKDSVILFGIDIKRLFVERLVVIERRLRLLVLLRARTGSYGGG